MYFSSNLHSVKYLISAAEGSVMTFNLTRPKPVNFFFDQIMTEYNW